MKNLLLSTFVMFATSAYCQFQSSDQSMSEGVQQAMVFELKGADKNKAENIWKSYSKSFGKVASNRKAKELILKDAVIPAIASDGPLMLFAKFDEFKDMTRVSVWFKSGDVFMNDAEDTKALSGAELFLHEYMVMVEKDVVKDELEEEEKALKNLQKDLEKLGKKNKDLHKDIDKAREAIRKAESEIERNLQDQADKKMEIEEQREKVSKVSEKLNRVGKAQ